MMDAAVVLLALLSGPVTPPEEPGDGFFADIGKGDGIDVGYSQAHVQTLATSFPPGSSAERPDSWYEYVGVIDCIPPNSPDNPRLEICGFAVSFCEEYVPDSSGPRSIIYRRMADASGPLEGWIPLGPTCHTDSVPTRSGEPATALTDAMILEQFHRTDFALPELLVQPPDARTLVNLPVYYELSWPEAGYAPDEIDTTTIAGHQVRIRPTLVGVTYVTGDGTTIGPTTSLGGGYPDGDITHTYTTAAEVNPSVSVEYGGMVSVDGDPWRTIPGTATVEGPASPLQVLASKNRLYDN